MHAAEKLKLLIDGKGISYTFISKKTGIPINTISKSLLGKRRLPADELVAICNATSIDLCELQNEADASGRT